MKVYRLYIIVLSFLMAGCGVKSLVIPGHAHNDYENQNPLFEALENKFSSIEVDVYLIDNELIVSHNYPNPNNKNTLESLYLDPMLKVYKVNGNEIFKKQSEPIILLVDLKSDAEKTYSALKQKLEPYSEFLSMYEKGNVTEGTVKVIVSGNRPIDIILEEEISYLFVDGRPEDLGRGFPSERMPLISENFRKISMWNGDGEMDLNEKTRLWFIIEMSHREGKMVRFWRTPDNKKVWEFLLEHDMDFVNTDDVVGFASFYRNHIGSPSPRLAPSLKL